MICDSRYTIIVNSLLKCSDLCNQHCPKHKHPSRYSKQTSSQFFVFLQDKKSQWASKMWGNANSWCLRCWLLSSNCRKRLRDCCSRWVRETTVRGWVTTTARICCCWTIWSSCSSTSCSRSTLRTWLRERDCSFINDWPTLNHSLWNWTQYKKN